MRLCIADPPYLGVAEYWYGINDDNAADKRSGTSTIYPPRRADRHPKAHMWDDPATHQALVERLESDYDGWAVAMKVTSLWHYLQWVDPDRCHVAAWVRDRALPTGTRPIRRWEPVLVRVPDGRRSARTRNDLTPDWLRALDPGKQFAGAKPAAWTRWVLDMLGYDQDTDTVDDLFAGSGAVADEVAQMLLPLSD